MQRQITLKSQISSLQNLLNKKHLTLNKRVLEDDSDIQLDHNEDAKCQKQIGATFTLEKRLLSLKATYLANKAQNQQWYEQQVRRLNKLYKSKLQSS